MADNQNITLSLPRKLLKQAKRVAADRETSVSALMTEALGRLADEDGGTLVVNCADNGRVLIIEAGTLKLRHQIPVDTLPIGISVPDDRFAYAANMGDDTISVIDIRRGVVVRTIPAGDDPDGIVFLPG